MAEKADRLIPQKQVQFLVGGVSAMTMLRWRKKGILPAPRIVAGRNFWRESEITAWIAQGGAPGAAQGAAG